MPGAELVWCDQNLLTSALYQPAFDLQVETDERLGSFSKQGQSLVQYF